PTLSTHPPVEPCAAASTAEDTPLAKSVVANVTDVDNATADLHVISLHDALPICTATLDVDGRTIHFTPDLDKNDGNVGLAGFTVTYKRSDERRVGKAATLTISVSAVNDDPVAADDAASTAEDTAVAKDVVANDTDVDNPNADLHVNAGSLSATNGTATQIGRAHT